MVVDVVLLWVLLVGDDALGDLTHVHEQQGEGEDPAHVVAGEVEPSVVVNLHL